MYKTDDKVNINKELILDLINDKNVIITEKEILTILNKHGVKIVKINNINYFIQAFVHKSYCLRNIYSDNLLNQVKNTNLVGLFNQMDSYERLEFLGDKVIKLSIGLYLFFRYPETDVGFMTRLQIKLEDKKTLANFSKEIDLGKFFIISKQIEMQNGRILDKIHEDVFEAFTCALFLNNNFNICLLFITNLLETLIDYSEKLYCDNNYKDYLLRIFHQKKWSNPIYKLIATEGLPHKRKYIIGIENTDYNSYIGYGIGTSKKESEQKAAKMALILLGCLNKDQYNELDIYYPKNKIPNNDLINILTSEEINVENNNNQKDNNIIIPYNINNILIKKEDIINILNNFEFKIDLTIDKIKNFEYIIHAFVHKSYYRKNIYTDEILNLAKAEINNPNLIELFEPNIYNDKLKIIGVHVLKLSISIYLFFRYENLGEGFMTRLQIKIEDKSLYVIMSKKLELEKYFIISKQIEEFNGRNYDKLHQEIFESFIGALCLSCGFEISLLLITKLLETCVDYSEKLYCDNNYKDYLLRIFHLKKYNSGPIYVLIDTDGPPHKRKYIIGVKKPNYNEDQELEDQILGYGIGLSKKIAEQKAAKMSLILLGCLKDDQYDDNDIYYYQFYKEKLSKYLENDYKYNLLEENEIENKYIVELVCPSKNIISYGYAETKNEAERKAAKMALILMGKINEYSSNDIFYYEKNNNIDFSQKSI